MLASILVDGEESVPSFYFVHDFITISEPFCLITFICSKSFLTISLFSFLYSKCNRPSYRPEKSGTVNNQEKGFTFQRYLFTMLKVPADNAKIESEIPQ
jgi:hypothetical protein